MNRVLPITRARVRNDHVLSKQVGLLCLLPRLPEVIFLKTQLKQLRSQTCLQWRQPAFLNQSFNGDWKLKSEISFREKNDPKIVSNLLVLFKPKQSTKTSRFDQNYEINAAWLS